jgi:DNA-3-methyladenine glycosylase
MTARARRWTRDDFNRPTLRVARDLLGKYIVRPRGLSGMILEVEAYKGPRDRAAHSYGGRRTPRVEALYAEGGTAYVYLVYGLHWMLNFSTAGRGMPEGVLIRAVLAEGKAVTGPGCVTRRLRIDGRLDREDTTTSKRLWIEDRSVRIPRSQVRASPRVGIAFAGPYWAARPWRFRVAAPSP